MIKGPAQVWSGNGIVYNQWQAMPMRNISQPFQVDYVPCRITDRFTEHCASTVINQAFHAIVIIERRHTHIYSLAWEGMGKQVVGAAVQLAGADDVIAAAGDALNGIGNGGHARSDSQ